MGFKNGHLLATSCAGLEPPLGEAEVARAEGYFGIRFPAPYRKVLLEVGNGSDRTFFPLREDDQGRWFWEGDGDFSRGANELLRPWIARPFRHRTRSSIHDHPYWSSREWQELIRDATSRLSSDEYDDWYDDTYRETLNRLFEEEIPLQGPDGGALRFDDWLAMSFKERWAGLPR